MRKGYFLVTLGPGSQAERDGRMIVFESPGFRVVDELVRPNGVFEATHKGICGASLCPIHGSADFIATTEAEVFLGNLAPLRIASETTHNCFNDIHHAAYGNDEIAVANAGCDSVEILSPSLEFRRSISLVSLVETQAGYMKSLVHEEIKRLIRQFRGQGASYNHLNRKRYFANVRKRFSPSWTHRRGVDMRHHDLRPHFFHPNHIQFDKELGDWSVTLFRSGQQIALRDGAVIADGLARPHDGIVSDDGLLFTESLTSTISIRDRENPGCEAYRIKVVPDGKLGFLRGLTRRNDHLYAGLTARRGQPVDHARICQIDYHSSTITDVWDLPPSLGTQVYSILDVTPFYAS